MDVACVGSFGVVSLVIALAANEVVVRWFLAVFSMFYVVSSIVMLCIRMQPAEPKDDEIVVP